MLVTHPFVRKLEAHAQLPIERRREIEALPSRIDQLGPYRDIVREGEELHVVNVVLSGWACHHRVLRDGRRQITALFLPGDVCGSSVFLPDAERRTLVTLTPVMLAKVPLAALRALMANSPEIAEALWWQMLVAVEIQRERTVSIGRRSALERMAHFLCEIWTRLDIVGLSHGDGCEVPVTQQDIADALGLSAVHVSRSLHELQARELVQFGRKRLFILDRQKLTRLAVFDPAYLHRRGQ